MVVLGKYFYCFRNERKYERFIKEEKTKKLFCWLDAAAKYEFMMRLRSFNNFRDWRSLIVFRWSRKYFLESWISSRSQNGIWILIFFGCPAIEFAHLPADPVSTVWFNSIRKKLFEITLKFRKDIDWRNLSLWRNMRTILIYRELQFHRNVSRTRCEKHV